ncbi:AI-2E family transporter [Allomesorhizobium alhagi]|uniref:AI-2E family transporter n=1 Tax=Allomesorhizobium alhagi TaxID=475067 RepID=UPI0002EE602F|nr:AI-2E family transporter [Mesorhizobium alhagi]
MAAGVVAAGLILWELAHLLLLVFAAILFAIMLRALSGLFAEHTPLGEKASLAAAVLAILLLLAGFSVLLGTQLMEQATQLTDRIPELLESLEKRLGSEDIDEWIAERARSAFDDATLVGDVAGYSSWAAGIAANVLLVLVGGVYLALHPGSYREGFLMLVPAKARDEAAQTVDLLGDALRLWLLGQLLAMLFVGALTTAGLWLLGVPSSLALGFIAGLLEFIPFVGPILSAAPAVAVALAEGPVTAAWVLGLYVAVQQVEGALITPLVQQRAVDLPPALTVFAIVAFGILFGPLGVLLATPLTVVCFVAVKKIWIRDTLEEETTVPGETEPEQE